MKKIKSYLLILVAAILLCIPASVKVSAVSPDYKINTTYYSWSDSATTITIAGNDTMEILKAPTSAQKIEVTSPGGSEVTIKGITGTCVNACISVTNNITLNIENLNIISQAGSPGILLENKDYSGTSGTMILNVSGICNINGYARESGIRSYHDQKLIIRGTGILNTTGGDSGIGQGDGGIGIIVIGEESGGNVGVGADLIIEDGITINATGGSSSEFSGGCGILVSYGNMLIKGGRVTAKSGVSYTSNYNGASGITVARQGTIPIGGNLTIEGGMVTVIGGNAEHVTGSYGISTDNDLIISGGTVTAIGGDSVEASGGIAIYALGDVNFTACNALITGGNGAKNGAHAIFSYQGQIQISSGANITATGGNGTTGIGGVGLRAVGYDSTTNQYSGNTVIVSADAGDVFIRGGQGAALQRASIMGKDVYLATGNIGSIVMEAGNLRSIKNSVGGDDLYLLHVSTDPLEAVVVQTNVIGTLGGSYTYHAAAKADGVACIWLPAGSQTVSASGYWSKAVTLTTDGALKNAVTVSKIVMPDVPAGVTAVGGNAKVTLNWISVSGATAYKIYQSTSYGSYGTELTTVTGSAISYDSAGTIIGTVTGSAISYESTGLANGTTYYFIIKSINSKGESLASFEVSATPSVGGSTNTNTNTNISAPSTKSSVVEEIKVDVKQGDTDGVISRITLQRTTDKDGKITDAITYQKENALETIKKLELESKATARIVIPEGKDEVMETKVNIPAESLEVLSEAEVNLQIDTEVAKIELPMLSLQSASKSLETDLYFTLVPVKEEDQKAAVSKRALLMIGTVYGNAESLISVVGNPVAIETNMLSMEAYITLPLTGIEIPTDPEEREAFLKQLAVYIEHTDGDKEVVQGEIVEYKEGVFGIRFQISKFSIFTIIKTDIFIKSSECKINKIVVPSKNEISGTNITASVANKVRSITLNAEVSDKAVWELYSDKACTKIIVKHKMKLKTGGNKAYIKVTAEDGTSKIYKITIIRDESSAAEVIKVTVPKKAVIKGKTITLTTANEIDAIVVKVTVSNNASWNLYNDKALLKEITNHKLKLKAGINTAYLEVTAENGKTTKVYTLKVKSKE